MLPSRRTGDISPDVHDPELAAYYLQTPPWVGLSSQTASKEENQKCQLLLKLEPVLYRYMLHKDKSWDTPVREPNGKWEANGTNFLVCSE